MTAGTAVIVRSCKYDGREHRRWSAQLLSQEESLLVLDAYFPDEVKHELLGIIPSGTHSLEYYWLDRWYNVFRFGHPTGELRNYYCNVNLPPHFEDNVLSYVDLDLDILVAPDHSYQILDIEDFENHARLYDYSGDVRANAMRAVDELVELIEARQFPFDQ